MPVGLFFNLNFYTMNFYNNLLDKIIKIMEAVFFLIMSCIAIGAGWTMCSENMLTNMFLMGFGFSIFVGAVYMLVSAIKK